MASASSSSAAVAALVQKASQQYLECRRKVTAKVDEVKALDEQLQAAFAAMDMLRERGGAGAKSVGRLEVTLAGVEGPLPAPAAAISVAIDPEFEADEDEFDEVEEVVEKRDVVTTDEHGHVVEPGSAPVHEDGSTPRKLKTTTKITRTIIKKKVKKAKLPVVRTIAWDAGEAAEEQEKEELAEAADAEESEDAEKSEENEGDEQKDEATPKPLTFPATFVFDPVQSREAVVILTVASTEEEDAEPIKEIEFPVSRLFGEGAVLDQWFALVDEEEEEEEEATVKVEEIVAETAEAVAEVVAEVAEEAAEETAEAAQEEVAEDKEEVVEEAEKADEEQKEVAAEVATEEEQAEEAEAETAVEAAEEVVEKEPVSRFRVKATFVLSEIEKLSVAAMALSKKKQEADAVLQELEREAASLRTKFERLNASQRSLSASGVSKPKSSLLSSRFASQPAVHKSQFQKLRESVTAVFTPQRQQVLTSVAIFVSSVALFHYQGENLLM